MFKTDQIRSLRQARAIFGGVYHSTVSHFFARNWIWGLATTSLQKIVRNKKTIQLCLLKYASKSCKKFQNDYNALFFFDELVSSLHGAVNKQICRIRGSERPSPASESPQDFTTIMVQCALFKTKIMGLVSIKDGSGSGEWHKRLVRYFMHPTLAR